jgi:hypothetical protein
MRAVSRSFVLLLLLGPILSGRGAPVSNPPAYVPPGDGWTYVYHGDITAPLGSPDPTNALDGTWSASIDSSEWDGSLRGFGRGATGGISSLYGILTLEDVNTGSGTANNRKLYFTRDFSRDAETTNAARILDNGITISFRARLTQPDIQPPSDTTGGLPDGYGIFSNGKANFNVRQRGVPSSIIGFSLVRASEPGNGVRGDFSFTSAGLTMNRLNGNGPAGGNAVDSSTISANNLVFAIDPNQFHEFWITIQTNQFGTNGTHTVAIYTDGSTTPWVQNVTAGTGSEDNANTYNATNYLALGLNNSDGRGVIDIDFLAYKQRAIAPALSIAAPEVTLTGLSNNQVLTNGTPIHFSATVNNVPGGFHGKLSLYDGTMPIFVSTFLSDYTTTYEWEDAPIGVHTLRAVVQDSSAEDDPRAYLSDSVTNVVILGGAFGFSKVSISNAIPDPPVVASNIVFDCDLVISNRTAASSSPLRVLLVTTRTQYYLYVPPDFSGRPSNTNGPVSTNSFRPTFPSLPTNGSFSVRFTNAMCPAFLFEGGVDGGYQFNVYAILQEEFGDSWLHVDQARIISSAPPELTPYDETPIVVNPIASTNSYAYVSDLAILGPTNVLEASTPSFTAVATLSDSAMGAVVPSWSVTAPAMISPGGLLTTGNLSNDTNVFLTASYKRRTTKTFTRQITLINQPAPARFTSVAITTNAQVRLMFTGEPGYPYILDYSSNLTNWFQLISNVPSPFFDTNNGSRRFYRLKSR